MEELNQQGQQEQATDSNQNNILAYYIDNIARALIAFCLVIITMLIINNYFKISLGVQIAIAMILGILISPYLSKVKVAHLFMERYLNLLNKIALNFTR